MPTKIDPATADDIFSILVRYGGFDDDPEHRARFCDQVGVGGPCSFNFDQFGLKGLFMNEGRTRFPHVVVESGRNQSDINTALKQLVKSKMVPERVE